MKKKEKKKKKTNYNVAPGGTIFRLTVLLHTHGASKSVS